MSGVTHGHFKVSRRRALALIGAGLALPLAPARAAGPEKIRLRDLWGNGGAFSALAEKLSGARVEMQGYMAPPLKAEMNFFVLTRIPMAVCPFCDSEASWPEDLILVFVAGELTPLPINDLIRVAGRLDLGTKTDPATGFVSRARLMDSDFARA